MSDGTLTETERLTLRNTLLANQDMGLDAAEATAVAYIIKPAVEAIIAARLAPLEALADEWERPRSGAGPHGWQRAFVARALRRALDQEDA